MTAVEMIMVISAILVIVALDIIIIIIIFYKWTDMKHGKYSYATF